MSQKRKHPLNWRFRGERGPDEKILTPEEIALEDAPEPVELGDLEDGHLENDEYRNRP